MTDRNLLKELDLFTSGYETSKTKTAFKGVHLESFSELAFQSRDPRGKTPPPHLAEEK